MKPFPRCLLGGIDPHVLTWGWAFKKGSVAQPRKGYLRGLALRLGPAPVPFNNRARSLPRSETPAHHPLAESTEQARPLKGPGSQRPSVQLAPRRPRCAFASRRCRAGWRARAPAEQSAEPGRRARRARWGGRARHRPGWRCAFSWASLAAFLASSSAAFCAAACSCIQQSNHAPTPTHRTHDDDNDDDG